MHRLRAELSAAYGALEKWKPAYLLLDGSLAPLVSDKPPEDSDLLELYTNVVSLYQKLYAGASAQGCNLVGVTKDSRGRRFMDLLSRAVPESAPALSNASDTAFLDHLLQEGERTFAFRYSVQPAKNPVLQDLGEWAGRILTFYLKPVAGDRPLRVEFLSTVSPYADIASVQIARPASLLDLVWLPATLKLRSTQVGPQQLRGYIPSRYSGTENIAAEIGSNQRDALILSRLTLWQDIGETGVFALGQKTLMAPQGDLPLMGIRSLDMTDAAPDQSTPQ